MVLLPRERAESCPKREQQIDERPVEDLAGTPWVALG